MIIFIKGPSVSLNYFIDCMSQSRDDVVILDVMKQDEMFHLIEEWDSFINASTQVITFNNIGVFLSTSEGNYWENKQVMLYNFYVDHPVNFIDELNAAFKNIRFLLIDAYHCEFVKNNIKKIAEQVYFLPHGGVDLGLFSNHERDIDILYVGSCWKEQKKYPCIDFLNGKEAEFYTFCYWFYEKEPYFQVDHIVDAYIYQSGKQYTVEQRMAMISIIAMTIEHQYVRHLRYTFLRAVAKAGLHVRIHGANWEGVQDGLEDYITVASVISPEECVRQMGRAKMAVNIQPVFTYGGHERIFNSMLNGAVCISNKSKYLEAVFEHQKDILFIDFNNLAETITEMKNILEKQDLFEQVRENAYMKVQRNHTWKARLQQILSL